MSKSTWTIEVENASGGWDLDTSIQRPNDDIELSVTSTEQTIKLANGDNADVIPEVKAVPDPVTFFFADTTSAFRTQLDTYIDNGDKVRITTHTGETFIGRFLTIKRIWLVGTSPDAFDIQVSFKRTE